MRASGTPTTTGSAYGNAIGYMTKGDARDFCTITTNVSSRRWT